MACRERCCLNTFAPSPAPERAAFDSRWCRQANRWGSRRVIRDVLRAVSKLGDGWAWYALMAMLAALAGGRGLQAAVQMLATGLVAWLLYRALKRHTRRPRPFRVHADIIAHVAPLDEYSFPSGHTLHAVSFSIIAIAWFPPLALPLIAFTGLVAASRVVLGLHYPSDVLAGALLGVALGAGSFAARSALVAL